MWVNNGGSRCHIESVMRVFVFTTEKSVYRSILALLPTELPVRPAVDGSILIDYRLQSRARGRARGL